MRRLLLAGLSLVSLLGCNNVKQNPTQMLEQEILKPNEPLISEILYTPKYSDTIVSYSGKPVGYSVYFDRWNKRVITVVMEVPLASDSYYEDRFGNIIKTEKILAMIPDSIAWSDYEFNRVQNVIITEIEDGDSEHISVTGVDDLDPKGAFKRVHVTFLYIENNEDGRNTIYIGPFSIRR